MDRSPPAIGVERVHATDAFPSFFSERPVIAERRVRTAHILLYLHLELAVLSGMDRDRMVTTIGDAEVMRVKVKISPATLLWQTRLHTFPGSPVSGTSLFIYFWYCPRVGPHIHVINMLFTADVRYLCTRDN
jgi:hypothetical protein